jgi:hypothetical protein
MPAPKGKMQLVHFRHKGLRRLYEDGNAKGVPSARGRQIAQACVRT